eukprot:14276574-Alexandrium_andersonii.AAC.1
MRRGVSPAVRRGEGTLSKREVGAPFADDAKKFVLEYGGHCKICGTQCRSGNFAQLRKAEQVQKAGDPVG